MTSQQIGAENWIYMWRLGIEHWMLNVEVLHVVIFCFAPNRVLTNWFPSFPHLSSARILTTGISAWANTINEYKYPTVSASMARWVQRFMFRWAQQATKNMTIEVSSVFQSINKRFTFGFLTRRLFSTMPAAHKKRARESSPASEAPRQRTKFSAFEERYDTATKSNEEVLSRSQPTYFHYVDDLTGFSLCRKAD